MYRRTEGITLASSALKLSSATNFPAYLANRFSYVQRYNDIEIKDIIETTDSRKNENDYLSFVLSGKKRLETIENTLLLLPEKDTASYLRNQIPKTEIIVTNL